MKKVAQLVEEQSLEPKLLEKLIYLDRLVRLYSKFMRDWRAAEVRYDGEKMIYVKFFKKTMYGYENYTEREFSVDDLQKRIDSYKRKIVNEFKNRHENDRLRREKEINKWKNYIHYAKIHMSE